MDEIETQAFPELGKRYDIALGVVGEFANATEARVAFTRAMRQRGYRRDRGRTWVKPGVAAVLQP